MKEEDVVEVIKKQMGYRGPENCCKACSHFVPTDCSGSMTAKNQHCTLNPAIDIEVEEGGWCKFHKAKK